MPQNNRALMQERALSASWRRSRQEWDALSKPSGEELLLPKLRPVEVLLHQET
jgi:hypothetical protein